MTQLSPERLDELAEELAYEAAQGRKEAAHQDNSPVFLLAADSSEELAAMLRAGAAAWRIATAFAKQAVHLDRCRALALPVGPCTCGLAALEQRLAALGGEGEQ